MKRGISINGHITPFSRRLKTLTSCLLNFSYIYFGTLVGDHQKKIALHIDRILFAWRFKLYSSYTNLLAAYGKHALNLWGTNDRYLASRPWYRDQQIRLSFIMRSPLGPRIKRPNLYMYLGQPLTTRFCPGGPCNKRKER